MYPHEPKPLDPPRIDILIFQLKIREVFCIIMNQPRHIVHLPTGMGYTFLLVPDSI